MSFRLFVVAICMAVIAGYSRSAVIADAPPRAAELGALPLTFDGWRGIDRGPLDPQTEQILQAESYIVRSYVRGAASVGLFVAYYATQRAGHTMHSPLNCLPGAGWDPVERQREPMSIAPGLALDVNRVVVQQGASRQLVYYWYQSRGRSVASEYRARLLLIRDSVTLHRSDGALVRVTSPIAGSEGASAGEAASFVRALYPSLTRQLPE
jgi:EpsI family protein